jgi:hypothetical protein
MKGCKVTNANRDGYRGIELTKKRNRKEGILLTTRRGIEPEEEGILTLLTEYLPYNIRAYSYC